MYSIVLMMALSGGAEAPAFGHHDCSGCHASCHSSCSGCHGGGLFHRGGHGCHSSCSGYHGCHSSCHGGHGCHTSHSCHSSCHGCHGGGLFHKNRCHGCNGCHGYSNCCGTVVYGCAGGYTGGVIYEGAPATIVAPGAGGTERVPPPPPANKPAEKVKTPPKPATTSIAAPALITVSLPADAKLSIDDTVTSSTSGTRVFSSPALRARLTTTPSRPSWSATGRSSRPAVRLRSAPVKRPEFS